ncbi:MAG: SDR family oxidoreductase [Myxococcota bacterium]|nr:SDR family oxidoreductase [Myxococcota bacterium]
MSDMRGRTVVVTGATTGIGKEAARTLAKQGADVLLVARDEAKARATKHELERTIAGAKVDWVRCDLASFASIRAAADEIRAGRERVDVLLNNAGALNSTRQLSADGHELTFAVNHLAHFLLTHLLRDRLEAAGAPGRAARVVNVASAIHPRGRIVWDDLMAERRYASFDVYAASKLCNVLFTYELARRLAPANVTANCLHPGVIGSGFGHNNRGWLKLGVTLVKPFLWTPEKGARTSIALASSPAHEGATGRYFDQHGRERRSARASYDEVAQRRLWELSETLCGLR